MTGNWRNKHPLPSTILFFKIILRTHVQYGKLKLPKDVTKKYGSCLSNPMFLKPPDGTEWKVHWTKHDADIWFHEGWKEFASYYSLDHGHMVLFEYKHNAPHFEVHIFEKNTLEIEYPFHGCQEGQNNLDQISEDSVEILDELTPCQKTRLKSRMSCPQPRKKLRTGTTGDVGRSSQLQNLPKYEQVKGDQFQGTDFEKSTFASANKESDGDMVGDTDSLKAEQLTSKITEALNRATNFISKNPSFIVVMRPFDVDAYLNVPSQFAEKYLKKNQRDIILQVLDGRTWPGRYTLGKIDAGWKRFASDNNLKVGDVCLFELTKSQDLSLKVLIFRLGEESHTPPPQGGKATQSFTHDALKEAKKFTLENPFFTVNIKHHHRHDYRPKLPKDFTWKYGSCLSNPMFLKPPDGTEWKVHWTKHDADIWFHEGWKEFASYYSIDHGHMVLFEYKHNTPHFEVHIFEKNPLEIEYPFHGCQEEQDNVDQISEDSVEILDELPPCQKTRLKSRISCAQPRKKLRTGTTGDVGRSSQLQNLPKQDQVKGDQFQGTDFEKSTFASANKESDGDMVGDTESLKAEQLTSKITEALNRATNFISKDPSFIVVMRPSDVDAYLNVPSQFAEKYLKKNQRDIILQVLDGRTWPGRYTLGKIDAGWKRFASDNNLKVGDVCLFELTKSQDLSLNVLIFRPGEESHTPPPQGGKATQSFTQEALKEANKFTSENPFFTVKIKPHHRHDYRPLVPTAFFRKYLDKNMQIVKLQFGKKLWPVKLLYHPSGASVKLSSGWIRFARESKLVGDVCVFELINKEDAVLDVHIFRGNS